MSSHSAKPTRCAKHQPHTQRQVCPPPEALAETQGGRGRAIARAAGGARGACSRILQNQHDEQNANRPIEASEELENQKDLLS
jgi:hypothetical protein